MSYKNIRRSFSIVYILIFILILTRIVHYTNNQRKYVNSNNYVIKLLVKEYPKNCWYTAMGVAFQLENCQQYPLASKILVFGKRRDSIANSTEGLVFIDITEVAVKNNGGNWVYQTINRAQQLLFAMRINILLSISKILPQPMSGLFFSLNFGGTSHLNTETKDIISQIGVQHLVAASGMQVSILVMFISHIIKSLTKWSKLFITASLIVIYLHLALLSVSILRAGAMCFLSLIAGVFHKPINRLISLCQVALVILSICPDLLFEIGFQLSFLATFGILFTQKCLGNDNNWVVQLETGTLVTYANHVSTKKSTSLRTVKDYIQDTTYVSLIVNVWLWPILLYHFSEINLLGLISGLALIWLLTPIFIFGLFLVVALLLLANLDTPDLLLTVIASPSYWLMKIFASIFEQLSKLDAVTIKIGHLSPLLIGGWYSILFIFLNILRVFKKRRDGEIPVDI